jgi:hypothetical protein
MWSTRIRALTGSRRGQWRPQGHPDVKIWGGPLPDGSYRGPQSGKSGPPGVNFSVKYR